LHNKIKYTALAGTVYRIVYVQRMRFLFRNFLYAQNSQMDVAELLNLSCALEFSDKVGTDLNLLYYILSCLCFVFVFVFVCACVAIWKPVLSLLLCVHYTLDLRG